MTDLPITLPSLRNMIGQCVSYQGCTYWIIEVLEEQVALVLRPSSADTIIQLNQFGDAHRRVTETFIIPVLTSDRLALHPEFLALELL